MRIMTFGLSYILLALCCLCTFPSILLAAEPIVLDPAKLNGQWVGPHMEYLEDKNGTLTIDDMKRPDIENNFKASTQDILNFGYEHKPVYWFRFTTVNPGKAPIEIFLEYTYPFCEEIALFIPGIKGTYTKKKSSFMIPAAKREFKHYYHCFSASVEPGQNIFYIRLHASGMMKMPLSIWAQKPFINNYNEYFILQAMFYAILGVILIYNLFIFVSVRESGYLYFMLNIAAFAFLFLGLDGLGLAYIWDSESRIFMNIQLVVAIALSHITGYLFTRSYLMMSKNTPRLNKVVIGLIVIELILMTLGITGNQDAVIPLLNLSGLLGMLIVIFIIGPVFLKMRYRPVFFFFPAYLFTMAGWIIFSLGDLQVLPQTLLTIWGAHIGTVCMVILFSLGLADKINTMKNELADLNKNLEQKVMDRTAELNAAMEELEAMNQNLKATMEELEATNEQLVQTRDALWGEMQLAKKIQTVLLPHEPKIPGYEISAYMEAADEVGGDYYDVINVQGRDWIIIGDVSGHGVPAGLVMMMVQTAIQTALNQNPGLQPSGLLNVINRIITSNIKRLGENKYMTITVFACIDDGICHFSGLHQDLLVYRKKMNAVETIPTDGMWIGLVDDISAMVSDKQFQMETGDTLLLYTDGVTESRDPADAMFSEDKLVNILMREGTKQPEAIKNAILTELTGYDRNDDVTLFVLKKV